MTTTREIDRMAQDVFRSNIPPSWIIREQHPDIYVDYFVEIADSAGPCGLIFGVQLKGTKAPRYSEKTIKISLKTKHLSYYLDKAKEPIFIVGVDVKIKQGYWLFIHEWSKNELQKRNWRNQKKIDVKIPLANTLSDARKLRQAILQAETYMRDL